MRAFELTKAFGLENLMLVERPDPKPGPHQLLLHMKAASLNFRDLLMIRGRYNPRQPLPLVPLSDGVGEVVATGEGVTRAKVGERVAPIFLQRWISGEPSREKLGSSLGGPLDGTLAEYMVVSEESVVHPPPHLTDEEVATLPCAAVTAWHALTDAGLRAGDTVVVQGTGGVSLFALQFARLHGARVIVTSSSAAKLERARALGASETIDYRHVPDWGRAARDFTDGTGVDHVVEVGGAGTLAQSIRAVRPGGVVSIIGVLSGTAVDVQLTQVLMQNIRLQGILVGDREMFEAMNRAVVCNQLVPVIDRVYPFEEARQAFEHLASGTHFGKICIKF